MNIKLLAMVFLLTLAISSTSVLAATDEENVTISVTISSAVNIMVDPDTLTWNPVSVGSAGGVNTTEISNIGSEAVYDIYAYMSDVIADESANPLGTSDPANYAAGGFVVIKNETGGSWGYVGRLEWNDTTSSDQPSQATFDVTSLKAWGWYRNSSSGTGRWLWELGNGTDGYCNNTGTQFEIEADEDVNTPGSRTPDQVAYFKEGTLDWGLFNMTSGGPLAGQCIAAYYDCTKIYIYDFDHRSTGNTNFDGCDNLDYIQDSNLTSSHTLSVDVWVPWGIPYGAAGATTDSHMTIHATG